MSRVIRRQLMSVMELLEKANRILEKRLKKAVVSEEETVELLSECQDGAVAMGGIIEKLYGEGTDTVKELKAYCETLYPFALALKDRIARGEYFEKLKGHVRRLRKCIEQEIPDRWEVVFLPYKVSMWDSLDSVYRAAKEDSDCDTYVVPIPYYDMTPEREFGKIHYEGDEFPPDIEITDWQTYQVEIRNPDVIYIHNPYDDINLVTSVPPRFYAKNLKNYTACLVYIPYFVLDEIEPEDQKRIEGIKHFCFLPGVIHADKVIVQSEKMRSIYISEYKKAAQKYGIKIDKRTLEDKILGLGSPKIDKVRGTKREDCVVPETWLDKIHKPDGSYKKIVLYNTSISSFLEYREKMLEKMKSVFKVFREKEQEVILLWRPHPLIQATIASMHPELWDRYKELVDDYLEADWGIYDNTPHVERAIAISDVYYGDTSSLVRMYQTTGKPIMIQDPWMSENDYFPAISRATYGGGYIWGIRCQRDGLYRIDPETGKMELMKLLGKSYAQAIPYKNRLLLIPGETEYIGVFIVETGQVLHYPMRKIINKKVFLKFSTYAEYGEYLFLFPSCAEYIAIVNMETMHIDYMEQPIKEFKKKYKVELILFYTDICCEDKVAYVPCYTENMILVMNLETREYRWEEVPLSTEQRGICSLVKVENKFFLISREGGVFCWNRDTCCMQLLLRNGCSYVAIVYDQGTLWLFPDDKSPIINYSIIDNSKVEYSYAERLHFAFYATHTLRGVIKTEDKIHFGLECANGLTEIDIRRKKMKFTKICPDMETYKRYVETEMFMQEYLGGGIEKSLEFLIEKPHKLIEQTEDCFCGKMIYEESVKNS